MVKFFADQHDFRRFPELSNKELEMFGFVSPHPQIISDFEAVVVKVHDGDTITLRTDCREFDFPLRLLGVDAPELNAGGETARDFVKDLIEGEIVTIAIKRENRVGKYGRLLGDVLVGGISLSETLVSFGFAVPFDQRHEEQIPDLNKALRLEQWF